jgi:hypothetical protein
MNIQAEKALIIERLDKISDVNLIKTISSLLDYAFDNEDLASIPPQHQKIVLERLANARNNPENLIDWDEAKKTLQA